MIHVEPQPEPPCFDNIVRKPGVLAVAEMVGKTPPHQRVNGQPYTQRKRAVVGPDGTKSKVLVTREEDLPSSEFPPYWTNVLDHMMSAYHGICAYSCFRIHPVTGGRSVDHMAPKSLSWDRVYEWSNYRLSCSLLNGRKNNFGDVLDPFEVKDDWFELELFGFQVRPPEGLPSPINKQVIDTITRLKLNDHAFRTARETDFSNYQQQRISFEVLLDESPFVAKELFRQKRLREKDAIKHAIALFPDGASKANVLAATGVRDRDWSRNIRLLLKEGHIERRGVGRATQYQKKVV